MIPQLLMRLRQIANTTDYHYYLVRVHVGGGRIWWEAPVRAEAFRRLMEDAPAEWRKLVHPPRWKELEQTLSALKESSAWKVVYVFIGDNSLLWSNPEDSWFARIVGNLPKNKT